MTTPSSAAIRSHSRPDDTLVSCLLVTLAVPQRLRHVRRCLADYCRQTHSDRELVVVPDPESTEAVSALAAEVATLGRDDIRLVDVPSRIPLGALRNLAVASARGTVLCQWDDDDFHHPDRIVRQLDAMQGARSDAVYLEEAMQYFPATQTLYCTHWSATEAKALPGTLMCRKSAGIRYPETGRTARFGEDTAVALQLQQQGSVRMLAGAPHLYVYVSHGANTWPDEHHRMLAGELAISRALLRRREAQLRDGLRPHGFAPGVVTVAGYNGAAFTL
jgi:glycosyltransferase involved in cell wall biosynthesis